MNQKVNRTAVQKMGLISRLAWEYARDKIDTDGLSSVQQKVCIAILNEPGLSQDDVAKELGMDKSSIAKLIARLMAGGYVTRETNQMDRREYKLYLDTRGEKITKELVKRLEEFQEKYIGVIADGLIENINGTLETVLENISAE
ncbi:MAG: MarR family winged helix-turn-helix transcriptional regulator [Erysipelotrichaceae bacterium]|nr:MarR family winged helix-turn-helix transcriptional regulator [Erysipelotrichaceae bacterium]